MDGKAEATASAFSFRNATISKLLSSETAPLRGIIPTFNFLNSNLMNRKPTKWVMLLSLCLLFGLARCMATVPEFIENLGQWNDRILYRLEIPNGSLFVERDGFTYSLLDMQPFRASHDEGSSLPNTINGHAFRMRFVGSQGCSDQLGVGASTHYRNYIIGSDASKWRSHVLSYQEVTLKNIYPGVNLRTYSKDDHVKYDLLLAAGTSPQTIIMQYEGLDGMEMNGQGDLVLKNTISNLEELHPVAYQTKNGNRKEVACRFVLNGSTVRFEFPDGYDPQLELVIDPELVFASYTGSTANNFGSSATYDSQGHLIGAGTTFGAGYPTTMGAFQAQPGVNLGGTADIGISKFSADGSSLIFSTYIGGTANETVHSTVCNDNGEVFVLGTSISPDFPTTTTGFQQVNNGGTDVTWTTGYGMSYTGGCDMVISRLSADGTTLLAGTYVGGSGNDGLNVGSLLDFNYGDPFRGEINVDAAGNVYVASCSESVDFPTTAGAAQTTNSGGRDGVVFKMNPNLSAMLWSTYVGGTSNDNAYSVQIGPNDEVYCGGGTLSSNFPTTAGAYDVSFGGSADGWLAQIATDGSSIMHSTYTGTTTYDQVYFIQIGPDGGVYALGQTKGNIGIDPPTVYSNPASGQFIQKFSADLGSRLFSTTIGRGTGDVDISPTAFLVSYCGQIYLSGWGGTTNNTNGTTTNSSTTGLPVTQDALQSTTDGSDFYLMMLSQDAEDLVYATYFGGDVSHEHVDGGTSRFDKNGVVYQAVCAGCGNHDDFPTTPGAWSQQNNSSCNLGVFKFDLNQVLSVPDFTVSLTDCTYPMEVEFTNNSTGANTFVWTYGDSATALVFEQPHEYTEPGTYQVVLVASDSTGCLNPDTGYVQVVLPVPPSITATGSDTVCAAEPVDLLVEGTGIVNYAWRPTTTLSDPSSVSPTALPTETTTYTVTATDSLGCQVEEQVTVYVSSPPGVEAGTDVISYIGNPAQLFAQAPEGYTLVWTPTEGLSCTDCLDPIADPEDVTTYYISITDEFGCISIDSVVVYVDPTLYVPNAFTPGPDAFNPIFYVYGRGIQDFELSIFNRWGQCIFMTDNMDNGWDGNLNGSPAQQGVYVYKVNYTSVLQPGRLQQRIGHVTLLRNMDE